MFPTPGTKYNRPATQISFRGVARSQIGPLRVVGSRSGGQGPDRRRLRPSGRELPPVQAVQVRRDRDSHHAAQRARGRAWSLQLQDRPRARSARIRRTAASSRRAGRRPALSLGSGAAAGSGKVDENRAPRRQAASSSRRRTAGSERADDSRPARAARVVRPTPVRNNTLISDFRVQSLSGQPVLTWLQAKLHPQPGSGRGDGVIMDRPSRRIATVHAGNGPCVDLHEPCSRRGDAYIVAAAPVQVRGLFENPAIERWCRGSTCEPGSSVRVARARPHPAERLRTSSPRPAIYTSTRST